MNRRNIKYGSSLIKKNDLVRIAVVIPCYRVINHIFGVIEGIGPEVWRIYVVDDKCPEQSGNYVEANCKDPRVVILRHEINQGVGGGCYDRL